MSDYVMPTAADLAECDDDELPQCAGDLELQLDDERDPDTRALLAQNIELINTEIARRRAL